MSDVDPMDVYLVTAAGPAGQEVLLNGIAMAAARDGTPPALTRVRSARGLAVLPPVSYTFIVVPNARAQACESAAP